MRMRIGGARIKGWRRAVALGALLAFIAAAPAASGPNDDFLRCIFPDVGKPEQVIQICTRLVNLKGEDEARAMVFLARGNMYRRTRQYDRALADYNESLRLAPDSAAGYTSRGNAWRGKHDYDRAIADHSEAIKLDRNYAEAYSNRGNVYSDQGDLDRAIADYDKAIELKPDYAIAFYNRGLAWSAKNDRARAIADYRAALKLNAKFSEAAAALKDFGEKP